MSYKSEAQIIAERELHTGQLEAHAKREYQRKEDLKNFPDTASFCSKCGEFTNDGISPTLYNEMLEALKGVIALHESQLEAQKKHYNQPWHGGIVGSGLKYDIAVCSTLPVIDDIKAVLKKAEGKEQL